MMTTKVCNYTIGALSVLNLVSRPIPAAKDWLRMESAVGRYFHHNLLSLSWAEVAHQYFQDTDLDLFNHVIQKVLHKDLFSTEV